MEMMINTVDTGVQNAKRKRAAFQEPCGRPATLPAVRKDEPAAFQTHETLVSGQELAIIVLSGVSDGCLIPSPYRPQWTPYVTSVDGSGELRGPDPKTGKVGRTRYPRFCVRCDECLRFTLLAGSHTLAVGVHSPGSTVSETRSADLRGSVRFQARAGGLYAIRACQPIGQTAPLFWVRDENTRECVSATCPP
jgi:hypothetical protein